MANLSALTVYNHYLTAYAPKSITSLDTHKKSELRGIYNSIVKINKESPLFLLDDSKESKAYAIGLKEDARALQSTIASLGGMDETSLLNKKTAYSTDESIATANYIGDAADAPNAPELSLEVHSLASPQVNMGKALNSDSRIMLRPDTYSFDLGINDLNYEFQFQVQSEDTNKDVQDRLSRLINNANIGLKAETLEDGSGHSTLKLASDKSGAPTGKTSFFSVSDNQTSKTAGAVDYFGLSTTTRVPSNAEFTLNGNAYFSGANSFTIDNMFEINLNGLSPEAGMTTRIGIKTDTENLKENLHTLVGGYNDFIKAAMEYTQKHPKSNQLVSELWHIAGNYAPSLSNVGLDVTEDGTISISEGTLNASLNDTDIKNTLNNINDFTKSLYRKSNQVSLNPMNYVDKTVVAYKNPGKSFANPYMTSAYTGMLFNSYC